MAILWFYEDPTSGTRYEVRTAGSSIRLYTNGAFHSQHSTKRLFTGGVWDLLSIPPLFQEDYHPQNILMLGVGGGASLHQINTLIKPTLLRGIEFDPIHIKVAREYFGLTADNIDLVEADAYEWVEKSRSHYDVLIDDLFVHAPGDPIRPFEITEHWLNHLNRLVAKNGILTQNHLEAVTAKKVAKTLRDKFSSALLLTVPAYENVILALYKRELDAKSGRMRVLDKVTSVDSSAAKKLNFSVEQLY